MLTLNWKISVTVALFLFCLGTDCFAKPLQAVVLDSQDERVVINRGIEDGVKVGQTWIVGNGDRTGAVVIEEAREHSSSGRLHGRAEVGSLASLGTEAEAKGLMAEARAKEQLTTRSGQGSRELKSARDKYKRTLSSHTESRGFVTQLAGAGTNLQTAQLMNLGVEAYNVYRLYDLTQSIGLDPTGYASPWWIAASAVNMVGSQLTQKNMNDSHRIRVDAEVVYWDEQLADAQAEVKALEQGFSLADTMTEQVANRQRIGVDKYTVFEVKLKNVGKLPAATQNFKYKMFMMSNEERPISASRVDEVLDKTLQPGDEVRGMIYFPKIVAAGQTHLRVVFEQMFGDRGEMKFKVH